MSHFEKVRGNLVISTDRDRLDVRAVHEYLSQSYWAEGIPYEVVEKSIQGSLCFGLFDRDRQIGLARVVTDRATFAYLCDVYVLEDYRGRGLGKWLMEAVQSHPDLQSLRRFVLLTKDAHWLYEGFGFTSIEEPTWYMEKARPGLYKDRRGQGKS